MFITLKNVHDYVDQAQPGSVVGQCGAPFECLIAQAVRNKYPEVQSVTVGIPGDEKTTYVWAKVGPGRWEHVTTGDDGEKLFYLGDRFDALGPIWTNILREEALELFK